MRHCREYYASGVVAGQTAQFVDEVGNVLMKVEVEGRSVLFTKSSKQSHTVVTAKVGTDTSTGIKGVIFCRQG